MQNTHWKDVAELVGISAIVASLVFVGLQMKQAQGIALAEQYQSRAEAAQAMYLSVLESGVSWDSLEIPWNDKSPEEKTLGYTINQWAWTQYDNHYFQYTSGFLDEDSWTGLSRRIVQIYSQCDLRFGWEDIRPFLRQAFVEYVESAEDVCSSTN